MRTLSAILLVLSSSDFPIATGSGVRGVGREMEEETPRQLNDGEDDADGGPGSRHVRGRRPPPVLDIVETERVGGPPAGKPHDEEDDEDPPAPIEDDDLLADTKAVAEMMNLSIGDAKELLEQQREFAALVDGLQDDANFLQAEMPSEPNGRFVLRYKNGEMPSKSKKGVEKFLAKNKKAEVKSEPAKFSLKEAEGRGQRLADKLEGKGYSHVSFSIDGDEIEFTAKKPRGRKGKNGRGRRGQNGKAAVRVAAGRVAKILDSKPGDDDSDGVALFLLEDGDEDPATPAHTYGGRRIYRYRGSQCTTAFAVIDGEGRSGISTAGHCTGMNRYDAVPPEANYATYRRGEHRGSFGDLEWHQTTHYTPAEYYARPDTRWPVRSVAFSISKGEVVCAYSRMQGIRKCSKVRKTSFSAKFSGHPRMSNLVMMEDDIMIKGDSGGPWSWYDKAYGIHSGGGSSETCDFWIFGCRRKKHDLWSRASLLPAALGVSVKTQ